MNNHKYREYCNGLLVLLNDIKNFILDNNQSEFYNNFEIEFEKIRNCINEFLESKKSIYLLGPSSSGKSTFLNHIMGKLILPQSAKVETRIISQVNDSKENSIKIILKQKNDKLNIKEPLKSELINKYLEDDFTLKFDTTIENDLKYYTELVKSNNEKDRNNDPNSFIKEVIINYPFKYFKGFTFYDTPGIDSSKGDTDNKVIEKLFTKSSSYVFYFFNSREYSQSELKTQIEKYKEILSKITNKRIIFIGTHYDLLKRNIKDENIKNSNNELSVIEYLNNLKEFLELCNIDYLDVFLINLNPKIKNNSVFPPLDKEDEVSIGNIIHKLNMHCYQLNDYYLTILINQPKILIEENIISFLNRRIKDYSNKKLESEKKLKRKKLEYIERNEIINESRKKDYFEKFLEELDEKIDNLLNSENRNFNDKLEKVENFANKFKKYIERKIREDPGGEGCSYILIKYKLYEKLKSIKIDKLDLNSYRKRFWHELIFWKKKELKKPFKKKHKSKVFSNFIKNFERTKKELNKIINEHYGLLKSENDNNFNIQKHEIKDMINKCENEITKINSFKKNIIERIDGLIENFEKVNIKEPNKEIINENVFFKFLNNYRNYKLNILKMSIINEEYRDDIISIFGEIYEEIIKNRLSFEITEEIIKHFKEYKNNFDEILMNKIEEQLEKHMDKYAIKLEEKVNDLIVSFKDEHFFNKINVHFKILKLILLFLALLNMMILILLIFK